MFGFAFSPYLYVVAIRAVIWYRIVSDGPDSSERFVDKYQQVMPFLGYCLFWEKLGGRGQANERDTKERGEREEKAKEKRRREGERRREEEEKEERKGREEKKIAKEIEAAEKKGREQNRRCVLFFFFSDFFFFLPSSFSFFLFFSVSASTLRCCVWFRCCTFRFSRFCVRDSTATISTTSLPSSSNTTPS